MKRKIPFLYLVIGTISRSLGNIFSYYDQKKIFGLQIFKKHTDDNLVRRNDCSRFIYYRVVLRKLSGSEHMVDSEALLSLVVISEMYSPCSTPCSLGFLQVFVTLAMTKPTKTARGQTAAGTAGS